MHFALSAHGVLLCLNDGRADRVAGRYPKILQWLCGGSELQGDENGLSGFARALAGIASRTSERIALTLPETPDADRAIRLASELAANGASLELIADRAAVAGLSEAWSPNGAVHWMLDSCPDALVISKLDPAKSSPTTRVRLDFSEAAFLQRQAVRDCFVRYAGVRLSDVGVADDQLEQWLDDRLVERVSSPESSLVWTFEDGRTATIPQRTLWTQLEELARDCAARLLEHWTPEECDVVIMDHWFSCRFGLGKSLAEKIDAAQIAELQVQDQVEAVRRIKPQNESSDRSAVAVINGQGCRMLRIPTTLGGKQRSSPHTAHRIWQSAAIAAMLLCCVLGAALVRSVWHDSDQKLIELQQSLKQQESDLAEYRQTMESEHASMRDRHDEERRRLQHTINELQETIAAKDVRIENLEAQLNRLGTSRRDEEFGGLGRFDDPGTR